MRGILAIALKDLRLIIRDREALFWVLAFPLVMAVLFGAIFTGMGNKARKPIRVAVVDEDQTETSKAFVGRLKKQDSIKLVEKKWDAALAAVRKGKLVAYVRIRKGYGAQKGFMIGDAKKIEVGIDPSRRTERGFLQGILMKAVFGGLQDRMSNPKKTRKSIKESIAGLKASPKKNPEEAKLATFLEAFDSYLGSVNNKTFGSQMKMDGPKIEAVKYAGGKRPRTPFEVSFPQSVVWGLLGIVASFAILVARERMVGTLLRLRISPLTWFHILGGKGLAAFLASIVTITLIFAVGIVAFGLRLGNLPQLGLAIVCTAVCVTGMMMLISTFGKTEQAVGGASWAVMMPLAMFGGGMIPLFIMPGWMQTASNFSPIKWAVYSFEGAIWRDFTLVEMVLPCVVLVTVGIVTFGLGVFFVSRAKS
jgi:ABC-2 type transport system permease protein